MIYEPYLINIVLNVYINYTNKDMITVYLTICMTVYSHSLRCICADKLFQTGKNDWFWTPKNNIFQFRKQPYKVKQLLYFVFGRRR